MTSPLWKMAAVKSSLLFSSSVVDVTVAFLPLCCMQAEQSIDTRNWLKLRVQVPELFEEYGMALIIQNSVMNLEQCAGLLKIVTNI